MFEQTLCSEISRPSFNVLIATPIIMDNNNTVLIHHATTRQKYLLLLIKLLHYTLSPLSGSLHPALDLSSSIIECSKLIYKVSPNNKSV